MGELRERETRKSSSTWWGKEPLSGVFLLFFIDYLPDDRRIGNKLVSGSFISGREARVAELGIQVI